MVDGAQPMTQPQPATVAGQDDFKTLAAQLRDVQDAAKAQAAGVLARAEEAGLDPAGLRRFVSWKRKDEAKRAQQEAIDQQCRYLAGERETPAQLPIGCELAQAINLYRRDFTVRQVAEELRISTGKAGKLRQLSKMFIVHVHATVDKTPDHDPETGEIVPTYTEEQAAAMRAVAAAGDRARAIKAVQSTMPAPAAWAEITAARDEHEARKAAEREAARERRRAAERRIAEYNARVDADTLEIPPFLRRVPA